MTRVDIQMADEVTTETTETTEANTAVMERELSQPEVSWATMAPDAREGYLKGLREKIAAEHVEENGETRARDENGRYTKTTETPAEGDETPARGDSGSKTADDKPATDWRDQETRELATAYGIDDEDLAAMPSREVLAVAMKAIDKKAFAAAKAVTTAGEKPEKAAQQTGQTAQQIEDAIAKLEAFQLDDELGADDAPKIRDAVSAIAAELKELRAFRNEIKQQQAKQSFNDIRQRATSAIHSLGQEELFGKPGEQTKEQKENLEKAIDAHFVHARGLMATGRQAAPTPAFLKVAVNSVFGDQIVNQTKQQQLAKLRAQSGKRTGGGTTKENTPVGRTPYERNLAKLPALRRALNLKNE